MDHLIPSGAVMLWLLHATETGAYSFTDGPLGLPLKLCRRMVILLPTVYFFTANYFTPDPAGKMT